jgi:LPXTG-motif cell wall-anchored protein
MKNSHIAIIAGVGLIIAAAVFLSSRKKPCGCHKAAAAAADEVAIEPAAGE